MVAGGVSDTCSMWRGKQRDGREGNKVKKYLLYLCFTDFSFQISIASLKFSTSQEFKVKINCSKENEKETGREMTSFHILNKPILILTGKGD